jgi:hypothetical protein
MMSVRPFFSHSGRDREIVDIIVEVFRFHNQFHPRRRPPIIVDRELLSRSPDPHWEQIWGFIYESDAVFLILTQEILEQEHTQNWVAFEVGVAAGHEPPIPVIAVRGEDVTIPIPYLRHHYSYSSTFSPVHPHQNQEDRQRLQNEFFNVMHPMLNDPWHFQNPPLERLCPHCNLLYHHHNQGERPLLCPCCSRETNRTGGGKWRTEKEAYKLFISDANICSF